jgi:conjugal transfer pilus assembly protein TraV
MNKRLSLCLVLCKALLLSGCGNQAFDCPYHDGVRCLRLSEVDRQVNAGQIGGAAIKAKNNESLKPLEPKMAPDSFLRTAEEVLSIWVAPYQDNDGSYHEQKVIHFVARPATWHNTKQAVFFGGG